MSLRHKKNHQVQPGARNRLRSRAKTVPVSERGGDSASSWQAVTSNPQEFVVGILETNLVVRW